MNDQLNIREIYDIIIREEALANGNIIMEEVKISADKSSPDRLFFDDGVYAYNNNTRSFCFIGNDSDLIAYKSHPSGTHPYIFNAFTKLAKESALEEGPTISKSVNIDKIMDDYDVEYFGEIRKDNLEYFADKQKKGDMGSTRINTRAGRLWKSIPSKTIGKDTPVIMFWCDAEQVHKDDLKSIKTNFQLGDFFWAGINSVNFNFYGDSYQDIGGKETKLLRSKIFPELSHEEIKDILMRAHSGLHLSGRDRKVIWEFRGHDPSDIKAITGGYDMPAQYNYNKQMSESFTDF